MELKELLVKQNNFRSECINLVASENVMSNYAKYALNSDLGSRYFFYKTYRTESKISYKYFGSETLSEILEKGNNLAQKLFDCKFSSLYPLSGHLANQTALYSFCKPGDQILCVDPAMGGYPGLTKENLPRGHGLKVNYIPYSHPNNIDIESTRHMLSKEDYKLVILSSAHTLFPEKIKELSEVINEVQPDALLVSDMSHPLGLVAGGNFENPLNHLAIQSHLTASFIP